MSLPASLSDATHDSRSPARVAFRLDLDKTYLATRFESLRGLLRIPFEEAADKKHLPGVPELVQALRRVAEAQALGPQVLFLSASPPQLENVIREKLANDGVAFDGIIFKDQLRNLVRGHWRSLREQVGYKLVELLESRAAGDRPPHEVLFGDDWESDPVIYSLYADILNGRLDASALGRSLDRLSVGRRQRERILAAVESLGIEPESPEVVERIYIRLEKRTPPSAFHVFGSRLVPTFNYLQTAAVLFENNRMDLAGVSAVASALREATGVGEDSLRTSLDDLARRGCLGLGSRSRLLRHLEKEGLSRRTPHEKQIRERLRATRERWRRIPERRFDPVDYDKLLGE